MAANMGFHLPRLPQAMARHQEAHPLAPMRKEPLPQVLGRVISLRDMCAKWWLERVQHCLRRDTSKPKLFALHRFLSDLPRDIRSYIIHNGLKSGGLHLSHGSKEIPSVNRSLVFLSSDVKVAETIYITVPKPVMDELHWPPDLELLFRSGEGTLKMVISLPNVFNSAVKRVLTDLCRTCKGITHLTMHDATDDVIALVTRHCKDIQKLDVYGSQGVTDEGVSRAIVNLKWTDRETTNLKMIDVGRTSVTQDSIMQLLTRILSITSFGSVDVVEAIEGIIALSGDENFTTGIEETTLKSTSVNRIQTLRRHCPKLNSITATFQEATGATLNDLRLLKNLIHVIITVREPFLLSPANLHDFVWAMGSKLLTLKVSGDVFWEADLGLLAGQCPLVRYLSLPAVTLPTKESLSVLLAKDSPTLTHLTASYS
ncbi:UNVERIFIED_CONTAM: hypothetical protein GTU68_033564 [Idotea baltica]|nr:hypothetical protein [Idotea baltica]